MAIIGMSFCFTGTMSMGRREIESFARKRGALVSHKVTNATDYLVAGGTLSSSKLTDARKKGVTVITPEQFMNMA